jgi:hypothetical protein
MSLLPEAPICISPSLAATLGLEEATLLVVLQELMRHGELQPYRQLDWLTVTRDKLLVLTPFWTDLDIQRVLQSLEAKGVIQLDSPPFTKANYLKVAMDVGRQDDKPQASISTNSYTKSNNQGLGGNSLIPPNWAPPESILQVLEQHNNVDREFSLSRVQEFIIYWTEKRTAAASWSNKFRSWVLRAWRDREADFLSQTRDIEMPMFREWQPSLDALDILYKAGINKTFIEDCIPEFVLYWQERGESSKTWNSFFIKHIRKQWARYQNATQFDSEPRRIDPNWHPSGDVFDILILANIDVEFARSLIPEFVMYWHESKRVQDSWNSKFLQHVKYCWAQRHQMPSTKATGQNHEKDRSFNPRGSQKSDIIERLVDRSWAQS